MERTGAHRGRIVAALSGGALEVVHGAEDDVKTVESRVCRAVLLELDRQGITLVASETGGREDRSTTLDPATGIVQVKWQSTGSQVLCDLKNGKAPSTAWQDLLASTRRTDNSPVWSPEPAKVLSA
jgi:hypothetical protein